MINTTQLSNNIKEYLIYQIGEMAKTNPVVGFVKPLVTRALNKNIYKVNGLLSMISDENGNIDVAQILSEMTNSVMVNKPFVLETQFIGPITIGGGIIKFNIPLTDKELILNRSDLETLKTMLTKTE